jgi:hypothetical protein
MKRDVAVELASECNWNDCFQTRITLAESPVDDGLPESIERKGLQVVLPGRVKTVTEEMDKINFCTIGWNKRRALVFFS